VDGNQVAAWTAALDSTSRFAPSLATEDSGVVKGLKTYLSSCVCTLLCPDDCAPPQMSWHLELLRRPHVFVLLLLLLLLLIVCCSQLAARCADFVRRYRPPC
jgi:hypothetical protein